MSFSKETIYHIAGEIVLIGCLTFYLNNKIIKQQKHIFETHRQVQEQEKRIKMLEDTIQQLLYRQQTVENSRIESVRVTPSEQPRQKPIQQSRQQQQPIQQVIEQPIVTENSQTSIETFFREDIPASRNVNPEPDISQLDKELEAVYEEFNDDKGSEN
jgi:hypothetical protein